MNLSLTAARERKREVFNLAVEPIRNFLELQRVRPSPFRPVPGAAQIEQVYDSMPFWRGERWLRAWERYEIASRGRDGKVFKEAVDSCLAFLQPR